MLSFFLLCPVFSINVSAADEENLIEPNLKNWTILEDYKSSTTVLSGSDTGAVQVVNISPAGEQNGFSANVGALYDITSSYKVGDKYTLSFEFLNADKYIGGGVGIISSKAFLDYNGVLYVGLATSDNTGVTAVDGYFVEINGDNYNQYVDSTITYSFEMPSGVVNPCIFINFIAFLPEADMVHNCWLAFRDIKLVNESEAEEDGFIDKLINGIKGLFVPDEAFISQWKSDMEKILSDHLGIIYQIPALTIDYVERLQVLFNDKSIYFSIPACQFELNGEFINLWPKTSVDFSFLTNAEEGTIWHTIYKQMYPVFLRLVLFGILIKYGRNEWDKVMMN